MVAVGFQPTVSDVAINHKSRSDGRISVVATRQIMRATSCPWAEAHGYRSAEGGPLRGKTRHLPPTSSDEIRVHRMFLKDPWEVRPLDRVEPSSGGHTPILLLNARSQETRNAGSMFLCDHVLAVLDDTQSDLGPAWCASR